MTLICRSDMDTNVKNMPAFPTEYGNNYSEKQGMTLRDYFAAKAMQSLVNGLSPTERTAVLDGVLGFARISATAFCVADAMLKARES